nr:cell differentiation protein RCD1 homolog [Ipomoea batatas]GMC75501.1 cell differentiation protein RCD1 homolog [Ipomoea batatas]
MANLPPNLSMGAAAAFGGGGPGSSSATAVGAQPNKERKMQSAEQLVLDLSNPDLRENALLELSKKRELFQDLAPLLWNSFGTIAALLQRNSQIALLSKVDFLGEMPPTAKAMSYLGGQESAKGEVGSAATAIRRWKGEARQQFGGGAWKSKAKE